MARMIVTNQEEFFNKLHQQNKENGFKVSGEITSALYFANYKKLRVNNDNYWSVGDDFVASAGTFLYQGLSGAQAFASIYEDYKKYGVKYVRKGMFGTYALAIKQGDRTDIFVDEAGNYALYYYQKADNYLITNLLYHICQMVDEQVDMLTLVEELNEYCVIDEKTYLNNTKRILADEVISIRNNRMEILPAELNSYELIADSFDEVTRTLAVTIKKYAELQKKISDKKVIFMTGGMDSRLSLAGDLASGYLPNLANWQGSPVYMNTKIEDQRVCGIIADVAGLCFNALDVGGDEPHAIEKKFFERIGEYAMVYGNNRKWHDIFNNISEVFYDFGYFGETLKEWVPLEKCYHENFTLLDYSKLYMGRQKHEYVGLDHAFKKRYTESILNKLEKICLENGFDTDNLSEEDCMYLYYVYRTHADTKMVNFANIFGYSLNLYAQKELIDYINQVPYAYKKEGKLNLALTKELYPSLLQIPYFSHCHYLDFNEEKMTLEEPTTNSVTVKIKSLIPKPIKDLIKKILGRRVPENECKKIVELFEMDKINKEWLPQVDYATFSAVGEFKSYFDHYTMLNQR